MDTWQAMKFQKNSAAEGIDICAANGSRVRIFVRGDGPIDFDEKMLIEMRNWINRQLLSIKRQKSKK